MAIVERGSSFQATVNKGGRFRRQFQTRKEAEIWEAETLARLLKGEAPDLGEQSKRQVGKPYTMKELRDYVLEQSWAHQRSTSTSLINADAVVKILGPTTPIHRVDALAVGKVRAALLKRGDSNGTVNRKLAALSKMLSVALELEIIGRKPKTAKLKESERRRFRIDPSLERSILGFFSTKGWMDMHDYVVLSLDAGLRQSEALGLKFAQVDGRYITVYGEDAKSYRSRAIPMTERIKALIASKEGRGKVLGGLTKRAVGYYWNEMKEVLELDGEAAFVPHILRHEFCSRIADRTGNAVAIMKLAGHSSLAVSQRYINLSPSTLESVIQAVEGKSSDVEMCQIV